MTEPIKPESAEPVWVKEVHDYIADSLVDQPEIAEPMKACCCDPWCLGECGLLDGLSETERMEPPAMTPSSGNVFADLGLPNADTLKAGALARYASTPTPEPALPELKEGWTNGDYFEFIESLGGDSAADVPYPESHLEMIARYNSIIRQRERQLLAALSQIAALRKEGEWIRVEDRLPKVEQLCLIRTREPNIHLVTMGGHKDMFWGHEASARYDIRGVTHWHPLPAPPAETTKERP